MQLQNVDIDAHVSQSMKMCHTWIIERYHRLDCGYNSIAMFLLAKFGESKHLVQQAIQDMLPPISHVAVRRFTRMLLNPYIYPLPSLHTLSIVHTVPIN